MARLSEFELSVIKVSDSPLIYKAQIPPECTFFQDVRRYQSIAPQMEIRIIPVNGMIELDPDMEPVSINKLTGSERKALVDYLTVRVARGDNIGYAWAFFRSADKKKSLVAYGGNVVHDDTYMGKERVTALLSTLQKQKGISKMKRRWFPWIAALLFISLAVFAGFKYGNLLKTIPFVSSIGKDSGPEMQFYESVFPELHAWLSEGEPEQKDVAKKLLKTEYVSSMLHTMTLPDYRQDGETDMNRGNRLILFVYFNYNSQVDELISSRREVLAGTEFMRQARIYSTIQSGYASNIFYFKVGDLNIKHTEISNYMKRNMISYHDFKKIRDENAFAELMASDRISYKMKGFLENVYTFTPLRIDTKLNGKSWYLLTRSNSSGNLDFAAFFHQGSATLVPKRIGHLVLADNGLPSDMAWYAFDDNQAGGLKLSDSTLTYFSTETGQTNQLEIIQKRINTLKLSRVSQDRIKVSVHRELLMGDAKGKYGIQTNDPITSLVLSNLITKSSFEQKANVSLKRDPIQFNTTLIQLSKDDSFSVQSVTITPGTTNIIRLFEPLDSFKATFRDGTSTTFEKASVNLFNPFTFMVSRDSITLCFRHDITDMTLKANDTELKIVKAQDGNYQIVKIP
ncbi:hypothetical protein DO021_06070 [Desulfobacter hydrogenophilus]|uniref:Uncharacterized protein n=1 Tax=Desulfobacter hydrogenophilus TaxID=2291 RepID=A0A328FE72_9BACT|nr:hypothetical protein [Desulfobacter hydrogenophilus]NDY71114.1 hypothetical protein [Desulfobacter hydrogenophilus]QBH11750.1 hypothetical protein EYB58_01700 [Desulfobacter hydrogenophilus]RAM02961.1 hypothetical protein DO021_06070 [Desulfobacter hydrogenophilus]